MTCVVCFVILCGFRFAMLCVLHVCVERLHVKSFRMSWLFCVCAVCCVRPYVVYVLRVFCVMCAHCEMCVISSVFFLLRVVYFGARHFACVVWRTL